MIERDYFSHTIPGYGKVWDKLHAIGYCYKVGGENIGWNNYPDDIATAAIHKMFMDSSGPPGQHPGQGLGRRSASAPTRARPARRCGPSCSPTSAARLRPHPSRPPSRHAKPTAEADRHARPPVRRPTRRPTPKPTPRPTPSRPRLPTPDTRRPSRRRPIAEPTTSIRRATTVPSPNRATSPDGRPDRRPEPTAFDGARRHARRRSHVDRRPALDDRRRGHRLLLRRLTWSSRHAPRRRPPTGSTGAGRDAHPRRYTAAHAHHPRGTRADQVLPTRSAERRGTARRLVHGRGRRVRRPDGPVGLGQVDPPPGPRRARPADVRRGRPRGPGRSASCPTTTPRACVATGPASSSSRST